MTVAAVLHVLVTSEFSGAENVAMSIASLLPELSHIYASPRGPVNDVARLRCVHKVDLRYPLPGRIVRLAREAGASVVHAHDVQASLMCAAAAPLLHARGIRIISHIHNDDPRMRARTPRALLYRAAIPFFDRVLLVSHAALDHYLFQKSVAEKAVVLPNIVDPKYLQAQQTNHSPDPVDVLVLGRLVEQKDPLRALRILVALKQAFTGLTAAFVGSGDLEPELRRAIMRNHAERWIDVRGFSKFPAAHLAAAKSLLMPSRYEGFGLVALEALLLGKPVVCTPVGGLPSIVDDSAGKLCATDREFVAELQRLLTDPAYYRSTSCAARDLGNRRNDVNGFRRTLLDVYAR